MNQALCSSLTIEDGKKLFKEMVLNTTAYLETYYPNLQHFLESEL